MPLYDYQEEAIEKCRVVMRRGIIRLILDAPTGAGKTMMAMEILRGVAEKNRMCEFICDRQNLVNQTSERFDEAGIEHGVLMGNQSQRLWLPIRISSAQTIESRGLIRPIVIPGAMDVEQGYSDLYVVDEAHERRENLLKMLKESGKRVLALTATSFPDWMSEFYQERVVVRTTRQLIGEGRLARLEIVAPVSEINVKGLKVSAGEFQKKALTKRVLQIVGDVVPEWEKQLAARYGGVPQPTIGFFASIDETETFTEKFREAGYDFRMVSSRMDSDDARDTIDAFKRGEFIGLLNCAMLTRGSDFPSARILINCFPTRSFLNVVQKFGRIIRIFLGKEYALLIDHAGDYMAWYEELNRFYSFGPPPFGEEQKEKPKRKEKDKTPRTVCRKCGTVFEPRQVRCLNCGNKRPVRQKSDIGPYSWVDGRLEAVDKVTGEVIEHDADLWRECCTSALKRTNGDQDRANRQAFAGYKSISGKLPTGKKFDPYDRAPDRVVDDMMLKGFRAAMIRQKFANRRAA